MRQHAATARAARVLVVVGGLILSGAPAAALAEPPGSALARRMGPWMADPTVRPTTVGATVPRQQRRTLQPFIEPLWPTAGQSLTVESGRVYIAARIEAKAPIRRVEVRLDGRVVTPELLGRDDVTESLFYQPRRWSVGRQAVRVTVWDVAHQVGQRTWVFRITPLRVTRNHTAPHGSGRQEPGIAHVVSQKIAAAIPVQVMRETDEQGPAAPGAIIASSIKLIDRTEPHAGLWWEPERRPPTSHQHDAIPAAVDDVVVAHHARICRGVYKAHQAGRAPSEGDTPSWGRGATRRQSALARQAAAAVTVERQRVWALGCSRRRRHGVWSASWSWLEPSCLQAISPSRRWHHAIVCPVPHLWDTVPPLPRTRR